jgi:multisubunit Na+/H+ antiporter MnhC subunit
MKSTDPQTPPSTTAWYSVSALDLATHLGILTIATLLVAPGMLKRGEVGGIGTTICVVGAAGTAVLAVLAYRFAHRRGESAARRMGVREWIAKRGVVYVLTQAPVIAIFSGFFFRVVPFGLAAIGEIVALFVLLIWVAHRKAVSQDPDEPVHHLARYALYALVPCVTFSLARIPTHLGFGFAYWHPWYDFGSDLTGLPPHHYPSLFAGAMLYTLDGVVLTLGYYVLFQKRSLVNAILYIGLYISAMYCFTFPAYARIGMQSPPMWHVVVYWSHIAMAVMAWYVPRFFERTWPRLGSRARSAAVAAIASALVGPYTYAALQARALQWPKQHAIDAELFARRDLLAAPDHAEVAVSGDDARYELAMQLGPRSYKNWVKRTRMLDVQGVEVSGRLLRDGTAIAWCTGHVSELPRINEATFEPEFAELVRSHDIADIPVLCMGSSAAVRSGDPGSVTLEWTASATLIGDRESMPRTFTGSRPLRLIGRDSLTAER